MLCFYFHFKECFELINNNKMNKSNNRKNKNESGESESDEQMIEEN